MTRSMACESRKLMSLSLESGSSGSRSIEFRWMGVCTASAIVSPIASWKPGLAPSRNWKRRRARGDEKREREARRLQLVI